MNRRAARLKCRDGRPARSGNRSGSRHARILQWGIGARAAEQAARIAARDPSLHMFLDHDEAAVAAILAILPHHPPIHVRLLPLHCDADIASQCRFPHDAYPAILGLSFDLIVIDCARRAECAAWARECLSPGGRLVLLDSPEWILPMLGRDFLVLDAASGCVALAKREDPVAVAPPAATERRAVFVSLMGEAAQAEFAVAGASIQAYADAIGATLHVVAALPWTPKSAIKTEFLPLAAGCDRFMLLDCDLLIRPGCPDLFRVVPAHAIGAFCEGRAMARGGATAVEREQLGLSAALESRASFNSGVLVLSAAHLPLFEALRRGPVFARPLFEQNFLNLLRAERAIPVTDIGAEFNFLIGLEYWRDCREGWIVHVPGTVKPTFRHSAAWEISDFAHGAHWEERALQGAPSARMAPGGTAV